mmetsp:Transcript_22980/g.37815  ORF Transcript_22980/g.37815 Transcript_22980/m.37815 type:complete len:110 (+) Transcript_22980:275-604(+)
MTYSVYDVLEFSLMKERLDFVSLSPSSKSPSSIDDILSEFQLESSDDEDDDEIIDTFALQCPSPGRCTSDDPVAKTMYMFDHEFSDSEVRCAAGPQSCDNFFRPIVACQ